GDAGVVRIGHTTAELDWRLRRNEWRVESEKQKEGQRRWNSARKGECHESSFLPPFAGPKRTRAQAGLLAYGLSDVLLSTPSHSNEQWLVVRISLPITVARAAADSHRASRTPAAYRVVNAG